MSDACRPRGHTHECDCGEECLRFDGRTAIVDLDKADHRPMHFTEVNCIMRKIMRSDCDRIEMLGVMGQRYIASTASKEGLHIAIHGTPGNNLGAFLNGPTIEVFGNAQDMTGNTMNSGRIVIHGNAWDVTGLAARGGMIMLKGSTGYRVGIHMKEYGSVRPSLIVGGTAKDYLGEYMAGGTIVVLGLDGGDISPVGRYIGAGMHGGRIYIRGHVAKEQLGPGAVLSDLDDHDKAELEPLLSDFEETFAATVPRDWTAFKKIAASSSRPFSGYYDKTNI